MPVDAVAPTPGPAVARGILQDVDRIASLTADRHFKTYPQQRQLFAGENYALCLRDIKYHLEALSQSLLADNPELYCAYTVWAREVLLGIGLPEICLVGSLMSIREVLSVRLRDEDGVVAALYIDEALHAIADHAPAPHNPLSAGNPLAHHAESFLDCLLSGDRMGAQATVTACLDAGSSLDDVYEHIFCASQHEIGARWQAGKLSVAMEHYVTGATRNIMTQIASSHVSVQARTHGQPRFLGACVEGEQHEIGLHMACDLLEADGWDVTCLGANTPDFAVLDALELHRPDVVGLSASLPFRVDGVRGLIGKIRERHEDDVLVVVGGRPFAQIEGLWRSVGADAHCAFARDVAGQARELLASGERDCA